MAELVIQKNEQPLKNLKIDEFKQGKKPDGSNIGRYRSMDYAVFKHNLNPVPGIGNVDLMLEGNFTNRLFVLRSSENSFLFNSTDDKTPKLLNKYGKENMGLNQKTFDDFQKDIIAPQFLKKIKTEIKASL